MRPSPSSTSTRTLSLPPSWGEGVLVFNQAGALNGPQLDEVLTKVKELDMEQVHAEVKKLQD